MVGGAARGSSNVRGGRRWARGFRREERVARGGRWSRARVPGQHAVVGGVARGSSNVRGGRRWVRGFRRGDGRTRWSSVARESPRSARGGRRGGPRVLDRAQQSSRRSPVSLHREETVARGGRRSRARAVGQHAVVGGAAPGSSIVPAVVAAVVGG
ncbi:hypothetical protein BT93_E1706 [Corymbia citriodora subsp. variegata]|nr:hypothetical protein BT93_E1706 [Corymbia citriodora subsp. variegata]